MIFLEGKKANYKIATTRGFKQVSTIPSWFRSPYCTNNKRQGQDKFFTSVWHTRWDRIKKNGKKVIPQNHTFERLDSGFFFGSHFALQNKRVKGSTFFFEFTQPKHNPSDRKVTKLKKFTTQWRWPDGDHAPRRW